MQRQIKRLRRALQGIWSAVYVQNTSGRTLILNAAGRTEWRTHPGAGCRPGA